MSKRVPYNEDQLMIVALYVLSLDKSGNKHPKRNGSPGVPDSIVQLVNKVGGEHSPESIFLCTHGFERVLLGRQINKDLSQRHKNVAQRLKDEGTVTQLYAVD